VTKQLAGKRIVVTGSGRGIGRAVALACADEGADVVVNARPAPAGTASSLDAVVAEIEARGARGVASEGSVASFEYAGELIETCRRELGGIDALINCAGVAEPPESSILDISPDAWRELIDIHLTGTFNTCRHAAPHMVDAGSGSIINTSSHAFLGGYGGTGYPAGKGGTNSLTFAIAAELRETGVRCNAICPGARTRLSTGADYEAKIADLHQRGLLNDMMRDMSLNAPDPDFVGPFYAFLASDAAKTINGRLFSVTGGYVGLFRGDAETLLAYKDHSQKGGWSVTELADQIPEAAALRGRKNPT